MGFGAQDLKVFEVLQKLALLSMDLMAVEDTPMIPVRLRQAVLTEPAGLAKDYARRVCIGCLIKGQKKRPTEGVVYPQHVRSPGCS